MTRTANPPEAIADEHVDCSRVGLARALPGAVDRVRGGGFYKASLDLQDRNYRRGGDDDEREEKRRANRYERLRISYAFEPSAPGRRRRDARLYTTAINSLGSAGLERYIWNPVARMFTRSSILA